eukprot:Nitzschia sp. Nitz4//scaffold217_size45653//27048//28870//NITZ4_007226-RA/size45653-snap-gene-0.83-mRNA-1//-1//CDS//3329542243//7445//frame0
MFTFFQTRSRPSLGSRGSSTSDIRFSLLSPSILAGMSIFVSSACSIISDMVEEGGYRYRSGSFASSAVRNSTAVSSDPNHQIQQQVRSPPQNQQQRIVILPGPHKTGSTTVQGSLFDFLAIYPRQEGAHPFEKWAYQFPRLRSIRQAGVNETTLRMYSLPKTFATLAFHIRATPETTNISESPLYQLFCQEFQHAWEHGYNLVVAAEALDYFSRQQETGVLIDRDAITPVVHPNVSWERLLSCLPPHPDKITVGIMHRTPRVSQLVSVWHQRGGRRESLLQFATKPSGVGLRSIGYFLNSMGLADFFIQRGIPVVLVDTGGMEARNADLFATTACHFLHVPCRTIHDNRTSSTGEILEIIRAEGNETMKATRKNVRKDKSDRGLDQETLDGIETLLKEYDCQFEHFARIAPDKIQLVYAENTFSGCPPSDGTSPKTSFTETIEAIIHFICNHHPDSEHCMK